MTAKIHVTLPGKPRGKGRARSFRRGEFIGHYTDAQTASYEGMIRQAAAVEMGRRPPTGRPVIIYLVAVFDVPNSYSKKRRQDCLSGIEWPAKKPDLDNIEKAIKDACNGVVWKDDAQVVSCTKSKVYGEKPRVSFTVTEL